jgi:hypothetical protein
MIIKLDLAIEEVNAVLQTLGNLPSHTGVFPLMQKIKEQAESQVPKEEPKAE